MSADPFANPSGTREEILAATYRALCEHGYADLTVQRIGEEFEKSPSLIYHHYEDKDDLVLACLEFMLDRFEATVTDRAVDDPRRRLEAFLAWPFDPDPDHRQFVATLVELRSRACHDTAYRDHFGRSDRVFERYVATLLRAGIDRGVVRDCDPEAVAATVVTLLAGVALRRSTVADDTSLELVRDELEAYLERRVFR